MAVEVCGEHGQREEEQGTLHGEGCQADRFSPVADVRGIARQPDARRVRQRPLEQTARDLRWRRALSGRSRTAPLKDLQQS